MNNTINSFFDDEEDEEYSGNAEVSELFLAANQTSNTADTSFDINSVSKRALFDASSDLRNETTPDLSSNLIKGKKRAYDMDDFDMTSDSLNSDSIDLQRHTRRRPNTSSLLNERGLDINEIMGESSSGPTAISRLMECWENEISAPEILKFPKNLVQQMTLDLAARKLQLASARLLPPDENDNKQESFQTQVTIVGMERMRASWVLREFLRCRIMKLETHAYYYMNQRRVCIDLQRLRPEEQPEEPEIPDIIDRLHPNEWKFLEGYTALVSSHQRTSFVDSMPDNAKRQIERANLFARPDYDTPVFAMAKKNLGQITIPMTTVDDREISTTMVEVDLEPGKMIMLSYKWVKYWVERGEVRLV